MQIAFVLLIGGLAGMSAGMLQNSLLEGKPGPGGYARNFYRDWKFISAVIITAGIALLIYRTAGSTFQTLHMGILVLLLELAAVYDLQQGIIPDGLIAVGMVAGFGTLMIDPGASPLDSAAGGIGAGALMALVSLLTKNGLGMGDAKLFACIGVFLGLGQTLTVAVLSIILSGVAGVILLARDRGNKNRTIPLAPLMLLGVVLTIIF